MYQVFPTMSVQLMRNLPRSGQLAMVAGLLALSGVSGLPFAEDMEDLVDTISVQLFGSKTPSIRLELAKSIDSVLPGMSPMILSGLANGMFAGDIGARTSLGDMLPGTAMFLPGTNQFRELMSIAGPVAGMFQGVTETSAELAKWAAYTAGVSPRPASLEATARKAPITMVRALADVYSYTQSGAITDGRGYIVSDEMSAGVLFARAMGFYPRAASD
ncbi:hypothetical protein V6O07_02470, partial [Arthrospira platensis SPKY2]